MPGICLSYEPTQTVTECGLEWMTNLEEAQRVAMETGKPILMLFTGTDWCHWCIRLRQHILYTDIFREYARQTFVLVMIEFTKRHPQPDDVRTYNHALMERYNIAAFPTILILDQDGKKQAFTTYRPGGPEKFIEHLNGLLEGNREKK